MYIYDYKPVIIIHHTFNKWVIIIRHTFCVKFISQLLKIIIGQKLYRMNFIYVHLIIGEEELFIKG